MPVIYIILLVVFAMVVIPLIIALFIKKDYAVAREIAINKPVQEVYNYIKLLKNQDNFSKWATIDPAMKKSFRGVDGTVGFVSAWESTHKEVGTGEQEIKKMVEEKRIDYELRFYKPFKAVSPAYMETVQISEAETKVIWGFSGHMQYPLNLMLLFMNMEKAIGDDFQSGLNKLKEILEK
jgi:hypothetical protein